MIGHQEKILFLNPPGRHVYLRDYFCSKVSQANYVNHPIDFVFLSAFLKNTYDLHLVDAIVEKLDQDECLARVHEIGPMAVVGLIGSASYGEDVTFYEELRKEYSGSLILIGDVLIDERGLRLERLPFVEAFLHDFSGDDLLVYFRDGWSDSNGLQNMTVRQNGGVVTLPISRPKGQSFSLPVPDHRLFMTKDYRYPFVRRRQFATVMTDFGCPYRCTFCIMSALGWKFRPVHNVMEELESLGSLGIRELFFLDQTFGLPRERADRLLQQMSRCRHKFGWVCFTRPDVVDDDLVNSMKSAGCHTVILGLESGSQGILDSVRKDYRTEQVKDGFQLCRDHGLRTVATLMLGAPGETEATFRETMDFLKDVGPDYASFNVAVPRMGTRFRQEVLDLGLIDSDFEVMDQSGSQIAIPSLTLSRSQIGEMRKQAIREFYFRFDYLAGRLRQCLTSGGPRLGDLGIQIQQGYYLLRNYFTRQG